VPRPRSLSPDQIAAAALAVIERGGLDGLTMRAVSAELGIGTMSLYRYVTGREELEDLVVDRAVGTIDPKVSGRLRWDARVAVLAERAREALAAHPALIPLVLVRRHERPGTIAWAEALLAALADGGISGRPRTIAFRTILAYTMGAVQAQQHGPLAGAGTDALAALPVAAYPNLVDAATHARGLDPNEEFRLGLDLILRGLTAEADRPSGNAPRRSAHAEFE
jgi:AcrR family transcriptional regulator